MATPGSVVNSGALMTPGGDQGSPAYTVTTAGFTVPAVGSTVVITVNDTSWMSPGEFLWIANANGAGVAGSLQIQSIAGNNVTLLNPTTVSAGDMLKSTYDTNNDGIVDHAALADTVPDSGLWMARLRSFNAVGNPTFEVDQRTVGAGNSGASAGFIQDRWTTLKNGTMVIAAQQTAGLVNFPGTNFAISQNFCRFTLTTQQSSLGAGNYFVFYQMIEGPTLRDLINDTHSIGILVRSSVANLAFSASLNDASSAWTITHLCSLGAANTWTWIPWTAIPNFTGSATWNLTPGLLGYYLNFALAEGSNYVITPDVWTSGSSKGATGMSNFAASPVGSTFDVAFVQHSPGSTIYPIDKPFDQNYHECLRYYAKSYDYDVAVGATSPVGQIALTQQSTTTCYGAVKFPRPMAKTPTVTIYNPSTGAANSLLMLGTANSYTVSSVANVGKTGFMGANTGTMPAVVAGAMLQICFTADTGW